VENATSRHRSQFIDVVRMIMSISRALIAGMRSAAAIERNRILSGLPNSALETSRATSMSTPASSPESGSR
jgi:hypothetical protein